MELARLAGQLGDSKYLQNQETVRSGKLTGRAELETRSGNTEGTESSQPGRAVRLPPFLALRLLGYSATRLLAERRAQRAVGVPSPLGILGVGPGLCFSLGRHLLHTNRSGHTLHPSTAQGLWSSGGGQLQGALAC